MRLAVLAVLGAVGGFLGGIVLSEIVGIVGYLISGEAVGIKYLSLYLAVVGTVVVPVVIYRRRRAHGSQSGPARHPRERPQ